MTHYDTMKTAKIFANGRSRAVRIPGEWLRGADEVEMRREGDSIILAPMRLSLGALAQAYAKEPVFLARKVQTTTAPKHL